MEIMKIEEQEDGSANLELKMSTEEMRLLVQYAVKNILSKCIRKNPRRKIKKKK